MVSNVPAWSDTPPPLDATGRKFAVLTFGTIAQECANTWFKELAHLGRTFAAYHVPEQDVAGVTWAAQQAAAAHVGWRFCVMGPEDDVQDAMAAVLDRGVVPAEITAHATSTGRKQVLCAHCRRTTTSQSEENDLIVCSGCGGTLKIHQHFSRHKGRYLGITAEAEVTK